MAGFADAADDQSAPALQDQLDGSRKAVIQAVDQARSIELVELALDFARATLAPSGAFLAKVFQGEGLEELLRSIRADFAALERRKPEASRARSRELYVLARGYAGV